MRARVCVIVCGRRLVGAQLIVTVLGNITNPGQRLVAALLNDLQITHLYARRGKVGNFEAHLYGRFALSVILAFHAGQAEVGTH